MEVSDEKENEIFELFKAHIDAAPANALTSVEDWWVDVRIPNPDGSRMTLTGTSPCITAYNTNDENYVLVNKIKILITKELFDKIQHYFQMHLIKITKP